MQRLDGKDRDAMYDVSLRPGSQWMRLALCPVRTSQWTVSKQWQVCRGQMRKVSTPDICMKAKVRGGTLRDRTPGTCSLHVKMRCSSDDAVVNDIHRRMPRDIDFLKKLRRVVALTCEGFFVAARCACIPRHYSGNKGRFFFFRARGLCLFSCGMQG